MTNIENHRIFTTLVAIAALASVLLVSTSVISGHIALAQTTNSKVNPHKYWWYTLTPIFLLLLYPSGFYVYVVVQLR